MKKTTTIVEKFNQQGVLIEKKTTILEEDWHDFSIEYPPCEEEPDDEITTPLEEPWWGEYEITCKPNLEHPPSSCCLKPFWEVK